MKMNYNSLTAKFYRWFYEVDYMPSNICPYFWKLVIAYLLCIPKFVITYPTYIFTKEWGLRDNIENFIIGVTVCIVSIPMIVGPIMHFFGLVTLPKDFLSTIACIWCGVGVLFAFIIVMVIHEGWTYRRQQKYDSRYKFKVKKPSVIKTRIVDWYHKRCTLLTWHKNED